MKNPPAKSPENTALGVGFSLAEGATKLFGRSVFKNYLLEGIAMTALVVTAAEYSLGAAFLLLVAYRFQLLGLVRRGRPRPQRLRFTKRGILVILVCGGCNVAGRGMVTLALIPPDASLATVNAIMYATAIIVLYSTEVWQEGQRIAAAVVPALIMLGLAVSVEAWHITASLWVVLCSIGSALAGVLYTKLSRPYIDTGGAESDQFQALGTTLGAAGLLVWAMLAGGNPSVGWSVEILLALALTAALTVVIPRYLHTRARSAISDGFYTLLSTLGPLIGLLVDLIMEQKIPTVWQIVGMSLISLVAAGATKLRKSPEWGAALRSRLRGAVNRTKKPLGHRSTRE